MPVFEQGYRRYTGPRTSGNRALAIAWENVRPRLRWWVWVLLLVLAWPYLVLGILKFLLAFGFLPLPRNLPTGPLVAFDSRFNPPAILNTFRGAGPGLFWFAMDFASYSTMILTSVTCAGLLASDRRTGALQIYFARPVTRADYLLGKVLSAAGFVGLTTLLPSLGLWAVSLAFGDVADFDWRTWIAPLSIAGASAVYAFWTIALILALSSVVKRPAFVAILSIFLWLFTEALGNTLFHAFRDKSWQVIRPSVAIGTVTAQLCGVTLPAWLSLPAAYGIALGLPAVLFAFVWWRIRAVEVVT